jgi:hypothetical protein
MAAKQRTLTPRTQAAVAVVATQLKCDEEEALRRLRERAVSLQYRVHNYSLLVLEGMVRFDK